MAINCGLFQPIESADLAANIRFSTTANSPLGNSNLEEAQQVPALRTRFFLLLRFPPLFALALFPFFFNLKYLGRLFVRNSRLGFFVKFQLIETEAWANPESGPIFRQAEGHRETNDASGCIHILCFAVHRPFQKLETAAVV